MVPSYFPPKPPKIAIVAEAPASREVEEGIPLVGPSGKLLNDCLRACGVNRHLAFVGNVFSVRAPRDKVDNFFAKKGEAREMGMIPSEPWPKYKGGFLKPERHGDLLRIKKELQDQKPNVILTLGNTAMWALTGFDKITKRRGTIIASEFGKILPTFHPAAVLRDYSLKALLVLDIAKAERESYSAEVHFPKRLIRVCETIDDVMFMREDLLNGYGLLSFDIETTGHKWIDAISLARSPDVAYVVPFINKDKKPMELFWGTGAEETDVWLVIREILGNANIRKVAQNGMYDIQYLYRYGIKVRGYEDDTMLLHHALHPEMPKDLGTLGSIYTNDPAWKEYIERGEHDDKDTAAS